MDVGSSIGIEQARRVLLGRMPLTLAGPLAVAAANFIYALALIPLLDGASYGFFGFALLLVQLGYNISNALCAMPMSIEPAQHGVFTRLSLLLAVVLGALIAVIGALSGALLAGAAMGLFAVIALLRWYGRTLGFVQAQRTLPAVSDGAYSVVLIGMAVFLHLQQQASLMSAAIGLVAAGIVGLLVLAPLGCGLIAEVAHARLGDYLPIWRRHGGWALLQVVAMEATANAHAYVLMLLGGPLAYSMLAVATLFWRPMSTVISAVAQSERPILARQIAEGDLTGLVRTDSFVRTSLGAGYAANLVASMTVALWFLPAAYDAAALVPAIGVWGLVMGLRTLRMPATIRCQAKGLLKPLATISLVSAPVSLAGAATMFLLTGSPALSLVGVVCGEALQAAMTHWLLRRSQ